MKSTTLCISAISLILCVLLETPALSQNKVVDGTGQEEAGLEFFEKKIRPVLTDKCYSCHSANSKAIKGGLRVDSKIAIRQGGDSGPAIVPANISESLLLKAIEQDPDFYDMPPDGKLPQAIIDDFRKWIEMGAPDPREDNPSVRPNGPTIDLEKGRKFWVFQPRSSSPFPAIVGSDWPLGPVDYFVLSKLEDQKLRPARDASRQELLRRVYYDLIGLPPTIEQMDGFLSCDDSQLDQAYERLVDELLSSPHFGERWGRHWLDVFRFAESSGGGRTLLFPEAWRYRDYVVDSSNHDPSFRKVILEQIAGDLLPYTSYEDRRCKLIATAFLALGPTNYEGQDKDILEMDVIDEQLETIGRSFLGMTIGCARCHDHKFDPIPTRDYYAMAGIMRSTRTLIHENVSRWVDSPLPASDSEEPILRAHEEKLAALSKQIQIAKKEAKTSKGITAENASTIVPLNSVPGILVDDAKAARVGSWTHSTFTKSYIGDGYSHDGDQSKGDKTLTFVPQLPKSGRYEVRLAYVAGIDRATNIPVTVFHADGEQLVTVNEKVSPPIDGHFVSLGEFRFEANGQGFVLISNEGTDGHVIADAIQFLAAEDVAKVAATVPTESPDDEAKKLEKELKRLTESGPKREFAMSVQEHERMEDCPVLIRGNLTTRGPQVPRGFLTVASTSPAAEIGTNESGRKQFAEWVADDRNPLTARVLVNRIWSWLMGVGIVRTTDNFGATGELASHPQLLDRLANHFVQEDWSVKRTVREIVLSHTYRMSLERDSQALAVDPENRLLWRMNRRRMEAEALRDTMLVTSGQLDRRIGGPNIKTGTTIEYGYDFIDTRRSIYTPVFRNTLLTLFDAFDFADPNQSIGRRNNSTSATQALYMMNDPFPLHQATAAAQRLLAAAGLNDDERIVRAYRWVLARYPLEAEIHAVQDHIHRQSSSAKDTDPVRTWAQLFQSLYASVEFRYLN